ncbi:type I toxin-antitoxin system Hok family toxin [Escherichia coli]
MKRNPLVVCLLIICITILTFTLLTRQTLYELRFRDGDKEVAALMACTSRLGQARGFSPRI